MDGPAASETESKHPENEVVDVQLSEVSAEQQTEEIYDSTSEEFLRARKELSLDTHLLEGKQHINTLLQKLTLLSSGVNDPFSNRYVSGCSNSNENNSNQNLDTEAMLEELDHFSRPNIQSSLGFNAMKFQQLYGESLKIDCSGSSKHGTPVTASSDTSLITEFSDCRPAPDGQGNTSDEVLKNKE
ncbi:hypothetical protein JTB14_034533 [Gonioctena quinquepunctata]|nr:hypothetical protein JTB14_034533 [Gonioctena quinquepunctata]